MDEVGVRLRALRKARGWSIKDLAERSEFSSSFVSQVERGVCSVSFSSLHRFCRVLGVSLADFFETGGPALAVSPLHADQNVVHLSGNMPAVTLSDASINFRFLSTSFPARQFEAMLGEIASGYDFPPSTHEGEEFGYVLSGCLKLTVDDEIHTLGPGDSYHIASTIPHGYRVEADEPVRILWVVTVNRVHIRSGIRVETAEEAQPEPELNQEGE